MKDTFFLLIIIVFGVTQAPIQALAISPSQSNTQDAIPTVPSSPAMREGTRVTPPQPDTQDTIPTVPSSPTMREGTRVTPPSLSK